MNSTGNDWRHNGPAGVAEREAGETQDAFVTPYSAFDDDEKSKTDAEEQRLGRKRKRLVGAAIFVLILIVAGAGLWMMFGGGARTKVNVTVRDNAQRTDQSVRGSDDATAQAIAEVRSATASPTPAVSGSRAIGTTDAAGGTRTIIVPATPVTVSINADAVPSPATEAATGQQGGASRSHTGAAVRPMGIVSERNIERSIRCAPTPAPVSARQLGAGASPNANPPERASSAVLKRAEPRVVLPPFGVMLPIRTMGALYTLRPGLARFELTRDVRGQGWQMRKGATIIGQQQGGEYDRAYVSLVGFIDPETKRFVKAQGEVDRKSGV